jgi:predicted nucleotide-binding protein
VRLEKRGQAAQRVVSCSIMAVVAERLPRLFIGSSTESLPVVQVLQDELQNDAAVTVWTDASIFRPTDFFVDTLLQIPHLFDFGLFLFEPDDVIESRGKTMRAPRDNVIFELGLFMSRLGLKRAFAMMPRGGVKVLSDISGLKPLEYDDSPELAETRKRILKNTDKPVVRKALEKELRDKLKVALKPSIDEIRKLLEAGVIEATGVFADAPNVVHAAPTMVRLIKASIEISGTAVVRQVALDMSEAWGILVNEILHGRGKPANITWRCLMIDPDSASIQKVASASVSVSTAANRLHDMRDYITKHSAELESRKVNFKCRLYSEPPIVHGFHIDGTALLFSMCDINDGKLEAWNTPYWRFEGSDDTAFSSHPARAFKNWFDHRWQSARAAWKGQ